jgi:hypothetical protein
MESIRAAIQGRNRIRKIDSQPAFERLVAGINGQVMHVAGFELSAEPAPYRGLLRFEQTHVRFFLGREEDTQGLLDKLASQSFVAVVGGSGVGKSSLVLAGLLPRLEDDAIPGSRNWRQIVFRPGDDPWRGLANALARDL